MRPHTHVSGVHLRRCLRNDQLVSSLLRFIEKSPGEQACECSHHLSKSPAEALVIAPGSVMFLCFTLCRDASGSLSVLASRQGAFVCIPFYFHVSVCIGVCGHQEDRLWELVLVQLSGGFAGVESSCWLALGLG